jgi:hypothetical protein
MGAMSQVANLIRIALGTLAIPTGHNIWRDKMKNIVTYIMGLKEKENKELIMFCEGNHAPANWINFEYGQVPYCRKCRIIKNGTIINDGLLYYK